MFVNKMKMLPVVLVGALVLNACAVPTTNSVQQAEPTVSYQHIRNATAKIKIGDKTFFD